jgi:hypothetical protein
MRVVSITAVIAAWATLIPVGSPATVLAQSASPETEMQQEMRHRRVIVRPIVPPEQVERDVERAAAEIQQQRDDAAARELTRPMQPAPQADQDLKAGIQTRNLNNAVRR